MQNYYYFCTLLIFNTMKKIVSAIFAILLFSAWAFGQSFIDSNLPIVVIETDGGVNIPDEPKVLGTMKVIWHQDGSRNYLTDIDNPEFLNYDGRIGIETRGFSSQMLEKKPYGLTTLQEDDETNNNVSILGMPEENDWVLNNLAYDQTGMRDVLTYELSERLGQYASRRVYCEVMINGDYKGLYVFMEKLKVDKNRVNIVKMDEECNSGQEVTGGYIVQTNRPQGEPCAWTMPTYISSWWWGTVDAEFTYSYPKYDKITDAQADYIHSVFNDLADKAGSHDASIISGFPSIIDIPSFVDFMMMAELSSNVDVYMLSTFFHKDRCGKLRAGPVWDYNLAYGHDEFGNRSRYDVWQFDNNDNTGPKFWKDLFDTDEFRCHLAKRWFELTEEGMPFDYDLIVSRMDEIDTLISEAIVRDNQRWNQMSQHARFVNEMKEWIQQRINWLNGHIGSDEGCADVELPPLVISKIHYHPEDWWTIDGDRLEFIEITNNGDDPVELTGIYFRELGITYSFPVGAVLAAHEPLLLCSDSLVFIDYYGLVPFGQFHRNLSNKSENLVLADAWGNIIDEVHYFDNDPWPWQADGEGAFLELIDLNLDNSLPESWTAGYDITDVPEALADGGFLVFPNPTDGILVVETQCVASLQEYRIANVMGQVLVTGLITSDHQQIDVSRLPAGLYFITVGDVTKKMVAR